MKSKEKKQKEFAPNNLGQPKVFTNGITWPSGKPSSDQVVFAQGDLENAPKQVSRKINVHASVQSDGKKK
jgi:hypothetical protein